MFHILWILSVHDRVYMYSTFEPSWVRLTQSTPFLLTARCFLILFSHLRQAIPSRLFLCLRYAPMLHPSQSPWFDYQDSIWWDFYVRRAVKKFPEFLCLKKCGKWFNMFEEWPSWSWNKMLASLSDPFMQFYPTIWRWDLLVRSLFRVVSASRWRTEPHRLLCSNSSPRKAFLSSPNHRTLWISLRVTFGCSLFWKCSSRGRVSHHGGHRIKCDGWTPEDSKRSLPPVHPTLAGSMEQVCVCARVWLWMWLGKRHMSYHYSAIPQFRELCDCPSYILGLWL